jgi:hypothetical protein
MARVVATVQDNVSSSNVSGSPPYVNDLRKSQLAEFVFSPQGKFVAGSDGSIGVAADVTSSNGKAGSGECLPQLPEGGLLVAVTSQGNDLQAEGGSRPVENQFGIQVDKRYKKTVQGSKGQPSGKSRENNVINKEKLAQKETQICADLDYESVT